MEDVMVLLCGLGLFLFPRSEFTFSHFCVPFFLWLPTLELGGVGGCNAVLILPPDHPSCPVLILRVVHLVSTFF